MIALHHDKAVPDSLKLQIALAETGTACESVAVDTAAYAQWSAPHRNLAPQGQVPVLVDGGEVMADSAYALLYVGEAHGPELVPDDPWEWYEVQALIQRMDAAIGPSVNLLGWSAATSVGDRAAHRANLAAMPGREKPAGWHAVWADAEASEDQLANARERIGCMLDELEGRLEGRDWLVGDAYSLADIAAFVLVRAARTALPGSLDGRPDLGRWFDRIAARDAVRSALADKGAVVEFAPPA
jgi:glutathione S-transferase